MKLNRRHLTTVLCKKLGTNREFTEFEMIYFLTYVNREIRMNEKTILSATKWTKVKLNELLKKYEITLESSMNPKIKKPKMVFETMTDAKEFLLKKGHTDQEIAQVYSMSKNMFWQTYVRDSTTFVKYFNSILRQLPVN